MVCTANDLSGWKDFPKGLRVLVLEEDKTSAADIRSKLEEMDYTVSTFYNEDEALSAISDNSKCFHVAIVEVSESNSDGRFWFLEMAKDLPTIMISDVDCLNTIMKCIALGAVEFLKKPLSGDKLKNIWQHVVHKVFNAGEKDLPESLKPIKESVVSALQLQMEKKELKIETSEETLVQETIDLSAGNDKYPAPSTPQIKQVVRLLDDRDGQEHANFSTEKESSEQVSESKSVENTYENLAAETVVGTDQFQRSEEDSVVKQEEGVSKSENIVSSSHPSSNNGCSTEIVGDDNGETVTPNNVSGPTHSRGNKANRRKVKVKVDWTSELHKKFVKAVEQLGMDQAIPSRILELMNVEGLTRHNVASHLQKYRMQRRHILPKETERRWPNPNSMQRNYYYPPKPVMAYPPPYHSNHAFTGGQVYPGWASPGNYYPADHGWPPQYYPPWQPPESWQYNIPAMQADAWGCPMMPPPVAPCPFFPQAEEVIDKVVKEAISKPWLPLPLGLKPPSTESVLNELTRQGISTIPPRTN